MIDNSELKSIADKVNKYALKIGVEDYSEKVEAKKLPCCNCHTSGGVLVAACPTYWSSSDVIYLVAVFLRPAPLPSVFLNPLDGLKENRIAFKLSIVNCSGDDLLEQALMNCDDLYKTT